MKNKKLLCILLAGIMSMVGCAYEKKMDYRLELFGYFDTKTDVFLRQYTPGASTAVLEFIEKELAYLHKQFDMYNEYEGINNLYSINQAAGNWVEVGDEIIDLITFAIEAYNVSHGKIDITLGAVLGLWHDARERALGGNAYLPAFKDLEKASKQGGIHAIQLAGNQIKIESEMTLDVGAIGKGFALDILEKKLIEAGYTDLLINVGGDVMVISEEGSTFIIGIKDPLSPKNGTLNSVKVADKSIATSGDYERFFIYNGEKYHHIIDKDTLFPAKEYTQITVIHDSMAMADFLSTALFVLPKESGIKLLEDSHAAAFYMDKTGEKFMYGGFEAYMLEK